MAAPQFTSHVCDVCRLLDGDLWLKWCVYCSVCDAWICEQDLPQWSRRGAAAALRLREKIGA
jgi:hypothetical protein